MAKSWKYPKKYKKRRKANTRYQGFPTLKMDQVVKDAQPDIVKPTRMERAILNAYYAEEHRPLTVEEFIEEALAEKTYQTEDGTVKVGPKWNAVRIQLSRPAVSWKKADDVAHNLGEIEPKTESPFANIRANMDFESMAQMNSYWEAMGDK